MNNSSFEEILERDGQLVYTNEGDSMFPLIRDGKDLLVIVKSSGPLKKYDIPLYKRNNGQYVLHRVLKVRANDYVLCGDNRWRKEAGITDKNVIGVLKSVVRDGKELSVSDWRSRVYAHLWCALFPLRAMMLMAIYGFKKLKR